MNQLNNFKGKKILIIGRPCSGKTTLGKALSERLDIPLYDLDDIYWSEGWQRPSDKVFLERLRKILVLEAWIISGNYLPSLKFRLQHCSDVIVLDSSWYIASLRYFKRVFKRALGRERNSGYAAWYKEFKFRFFLNKVVFYSRYYRAFYAFLNATEGKVKMHRLDS